MPGVVLGDVGHWQARRLKERFANETLASVQTSPLERARETAAAIAAGRNLDVTVCDGIMEIDFGAWTGQPFEDLARDSRWNAWNMARAVNRPPGGESMLQAQARIVQAMADLRHAYGGQAVVLVSHGDVIKAALLYHLGLPIDAYGRFDIEPASVSTLAVGDWGSRLIRLNEVIAA
jgi:broad specificity phosphatase PhoE